MEHRPAQIFDDVEMPVWSLDAMEVPSNDAWMTIGSNMLPTMRVAAVTLTKTKPELLQLVRDMVNVEGVEEGAAFLELFEALDATKCQFMAWSTAIEAAQSRLYAAMGKLEEIEGRPIVEDDPSTQH